MRKKSLFEDILETAFKNPIFGIVISIFLVGLGLYLTNKQAPVGAKPSDLMFIPAMHMFGKISYIFSAIVLIFTGIGYTVFSIKKKNQTAFFETRRTLDDIKHLSWKEFEEFVGSLFVKLGYDVEVTGGLADGGIDLIVKKDGRTSFVQCKKYQTSKVSLSMVRDFYGAMNSNLNFESGYFITTGIFTLEAKHFAEDKPIELIDGSKLMDYVRITESKEIPTRQSIKTAKLSKTPICSKCGASMVLRTAKKGNMVGSQFWGCSTYPKCRGTKTITA